MKGKIKKCITRLIATSMLLAILLLITVFNPTLLYSNESQVGNFTVHHSTPLTSTLITRLNRVDSIIQKSELYDKSFKLEICLNDDSFYPTIIKKLKGNGFAWGFYNKIVLNGESDFKLNHTMLNGYQWNLEQLIVHEAIHCYQFNAFGFWGSNPVSNYPNWKWEGYPEYIARQNPDQLEFHENIKKLVNAKKNKKGVIHFQDGTIASTNYFRDWLLVKYSMEIKGMSYKGLLENTIDQNSLENEMINWSRNTHSFN